MNTNETTRDVFDGKFPPENYGRTPTEVELTVQQVIERHFLDEDGILLNAVNGQTMQPYRTEDVKDRVDGVGTYVEFSKIPREVKPIWANYENSGQVSGVYLCGLCAKARATGNLDDRGDAAGVVNAIEKLWKNAAAVKFSLGGGGKGWFPKPYGGIRHAEGMHECSVDQYCDVTLGLQSYYQTFADEEEKRRIEEIVISFADWWYDHDFAGVYLGEAIWYKRLDTHSMAASFFLYLFALANSWSPCRKFQHGFEIWQELRGMLFPPGEAVWICMNGLTLDCLERLVALRPDLADYWRSIANHQAPLVVASVEKQTGLNRMYELDGYAANYLMAAHRILPHSDYDQRARQYLERVSRREQFYHVRRGLQLSDLQPPMQGDDYRDMFSAEVHVHWLAGYWKLREIGALNS